MSNDVGRLTQRLYIDTDPGVQRELEQDQVIRALSPTLCRVGLMGSANCGLLK